MKTCNMFLLSLCSNFLVVSECFFSIIKLARDALKELIETNSGKYAIEVATHLNDVF